MEKIFQFFRIFRIYHTAVVFTLGKITLEKGQMYIIISKQGNFNGKKYGKTRNFLLKLE